jgi:hypothetical protein
MTYQVDPHLFGLIPALEQGVSFGFQLGNDGIPVRHFSSTFFHIGFKVMKERIKLCTFL